MAEKLRLDALLVERGLAESRARAQALVLAGLVWSDGKRLNKPGGYEVLWKDAKKKNRACNATG